MSLATLIDAVGRSGGGVLVLVVPPRGDPCDEAFARAAAGDVRGALRSARAAVRERDDARSRFALGWALVLAGRGARGYPLFRAGVGPPETVCPPLGLVATWMEDFDTARRAPDGVPELEFRLGDWRAARAHATGHTLARLDAVTGDFAAARAALRAGVVGLGARRARAARAQRRRRGPRARAPRAREPARALQRPARAERGPVGA